jgi:hypothetical protein
MLQQTARITNVAQAYEVIKEMNPLAQEFTFFYLLPPFPKNTPGLIFFFTKEKKNIIMTRQLIGII